MATNNRPAFPSIPQRSIVADDHNFNGVNQRKSLQSMHRHSNKELAEPFQLQSVRQKPISLFGKAVPVEPFLTPNSKKARNESKQNPPSSD